MRTIQRLRALLPFAGFALLAVILLFWLPMLSGCGPSTGACYGYDADYDECYEDWDQADCDAFDATFTNGHSWAFAKGKSCPDVGFSFWCAAWQFYGNSADDCF
jgi:hypothetical protein